MAEIKNEGQVVNLNDRIEVKATEKHPFAEKDEVLKMHPKLAEALVKKGFVKK